MVVYRLVLGGSSVQVVVYRLVLGGSVQVGPRW